MRIEPMDSHHFEGIMKIYAQGIATGNATFQTDIPDWSSWNKSHLLKGRLVMVEKDEVIGWAALSAISERCAYAGVAEISLYVADQHQRKGIGKKLLNAIILDSEGIGIWTLQAGIFPENIASLKLHESCGFRQIGYREKIGQLQNKWRDTIILERRSKNVGM